MNQTSQPNLEAGPEMNPPTLISDPGIQKFIPGQSDARVLRNTLGRFATGVTIVSVDSPNGPVGMTVNSFSSVSLDPPLIQWAVAKKAGRYELFVEAEEFSVSVLRVEHTQIAYDFSAEAQAFDHDQWAINSGQPPLLKTALASFRCSRESLHDGGDHTIIIGRVIDGAFSDGAPLLFFKGEFGHFSVLRN